MNLKNFILRGQPHSAKAVANLVNNAQWLVAGLTHVEEDQNLSYEIDRYFIATCDTANEEKPQIIKLYDNHFEKTGEAKGTSEGVCAKVKFNRRMFYCQFLSYYFDGFFSSGYH